MGTYIAKLTNNNEHWFKITDGVSNHDYQSIDLNDALPYDPNNNMADQWFKFANFNNNDSFLPILENHFDCADLESINRESYDKIELIAFFENRRFYIQKISKSSFLKKKLFAPLGDLVEYKELDNVIYISQKPNCIYDQVNHNLYFMSIQKAYAVFKGLRGDYREATADEINSFLNSDIVKTSDEFNEAKVGMYNRKQISSILNIYNTYSSEDKQTLRDYIRNSVRGDLNYTEDGKFEIESDKQLRLLLLGIQQRFYNQPLQQDEVQVATNTTKLSNLL